MTAPTWLDTLIGPSTITINGGAPLATRKTVNLVGPNVTATDDPVNLITNVALSPWMTALDLDFTTQGSQTLTSDGNYTIGGLTWVKGNSAGDGTAMAVTNGTGLVITPASATNISTSTLSFPYLRIPLVSLFPAYTFYTGVRVWLYQSASNEGANYDQTMFGLMMYNASYNNQLTLFAFRGYAGAANGWGLWSEVLQANIGGTTPSAPFTNRVGVLDYPMGMLGSAAGGLLIGDYSSGWPAASALKLVASPTMTLAGSLVMANASSGLNGPGAANLVIGALRNGSGTAYQSTIARVRVDVMAVG